MPLFDGQKDQPVVAVYPGSFNPPTTAHLAIAEAAQSSHGLDRVDLTISRSALAKEHVDHPRFEHRIDVLEEVVAGIDWLAVRVTEDQLLVDVASGYDLLIMGADKWWQIQDPAWYGDSEQNRDAVLARLPAVAVAPREGFDLPIERALNVAPAAISNISSTQAREGNLAQMLPAARSFATASGAWIDPERYDRWLATQTE